MMKDWEEIKLGEFMAKKGNSINPKKHLGETFELFSVPNHSIKKPEIVKGEKIGSSKQVIGDNWVLLSRINPHLNRSWVVESKSKLRKIASSEWVKFPPSKFYFSEYLGLFLTNSEFKNYMCMNVSGVGGSLTRTNKHAISEFNFPLPPLPIQRAIVSKMESQFSSLDSGIADLKKAQAQLKIYRQAVLKKAFEGELTKEWREQQKDLLSADELFKLIKEERKKHYNKQIAEWEIKVKVWEEQGNVGKKPSKPRMKPLLNACNNILFRLPQAWGWFKLGNVANKVSDGPFGSNLKTADYIDSGIRVIRLENIGNLEFKNSKKSFVSQEKYQSIRKHTVYPKDLIFGSFISEDVSVVSIPDYIEYAINKADCFCVRFDYNVNYKFFEYFLSTRSTYLQLVHQIHGATRPRINTTQLKEVLVPLCSKNEQNQIVKAIESRLSVCDKVEKDIKGSLVKAQALRQSILKKAFEGKLLTAAEIERCKKEADYEPASVLLERIRKEKAN